MQNDELNSEFEYDSEADRKKRRRLDLAVKSQPHISKVHKSFFNEEQSKEESKRRNLLTLDAYSRHKQLINEYFLCFPGATKQLLTRDTSRDKTDADVIRHNHKFLWNEEDVTDSWEKRLAKKYYDKLFKEYCIADLSYYKANKIAMRWRTEKELISGKGQFECGEKSCSEKEALQSWEVNFAYVEDGQKKNALIKLRLCIDCSNKLNYKRKRRLVEKPKRRKKKRNKEDSSGEEETPTTSQAGKDAQNDTASEPKAMEKPGSDELWEKPREIEEERPREDEFEEFLDDLLL